MHQLKIRTDEGYLKVHRPTTEHVLRSDLGEVAKTMFIFLLNQFHNNNPKETCIQLSNREICKAIGFQERALPDRRAARSEKRINTRLKIPGPDLASAYPSKARR